MEFPGVFKFNTTTSFSSSQPCSWKNIFIMQSAQCINIQYHFSLLPLYHDLQVQPEVNCVLIEIYTSNVQIFFSLFCNLAEINVLPYV